MAKATGTREIVVLHIESIRISGDNALITGTDVDGNALHGAIGTHSVRTTSELAPHRRVMGRYTLTRSVDAAQYVGGYFVLNAIVDRETGRFTYAKVVDFDAPIAE